MKLPKIKPPTQKMIDAGNEVASEMFDASIQKALGGLGGCKQLKFSRFKHKKIVKLHIENKIDSVTGIFMAMIEAEQKENDNGSI